MVADPRDLVAPRAWARPMRRGAATVMGKYEKGKPTAATKTADQIGHGHGFTIGSETFMAKPTEEDGLHDGEEAFGAAPHERPVPRISIHAFCEFPDTGAALQRAAADRRLAKAHVTIQLGGLQGAVEHYTGQVTPNLLIVETRLQGEAALAEIDRLAEVCDPTTKVVIVGRVNDVELYRELIRRGVSEYLVAPVSPLHLIEVISGLYLNPDAAPIGRVVSFIAARGGAGSSTLAHNAGWSIAERLHINTAIVDLDSALRHRQPRFQRGAGPGRRRCAVGARAPRRCAARPAAAEGRRPSVAVHRTGHSRARLRCRRRRPMSP